MPRLGEYVVHWQKMCTFEKDYWVQILGEAKSVRLFEKDVLHSLFE